MAIKAPKWVANMKAVPTYSGWMVTKPKGKQEIVKAARFSAEQIAEWYAAQNTAAHKPAPQMLNEAPSVERTLNSLEMSHHYDEEF